ncbi:hypothetical protein POM88_053755 [Heracleum sosnowskyi]|uniref:Uncharacterized protein n=1 Tax=Heracleum sosnowskyi TaxID=360622 RepID=A0AAD8GP21_9APIA|nr:hypothetical protein POM88_053755 [Heracleum sosnowskyi]
MIRREKETVLSNLWKVYKPGLESWLVRLLRPVIDDFKKPENSERVEINQFALGDMPLSIWNAEPHAVSMICHNNDSSTSAAENYELRKQSSPQKLQKYGPEEPVTRKPVEASTKLLYSVLKIA